MVTSKSADQPIRDWRALRYTDPFRSNRDADSSTVLFSESSAYSYSHVPPAICAYSFTPSPEKKVGSITCSDKPKLRLPAILPKRRPSLPLTDIYTGSRAAGRVRDFANPTYCSTYPTVLNFFADMETL